VLGTKVDWRYCVEEDSAVLDPTAFQIGEKITEPHDRPWHALPLPVNSDDLNIF
jgi:hypothetical protein